MELGAPSVMVRLVGEEGSAGWVTGDGRPLSVRPDTAPDEHGESSGGGVTGDRVASVCLDRSRKRK